MAVRHVLPVTAFRAAMSRAARRGGVACLAVLALAALLAGCAGEKSEEVDDGPLAVQIDAASGADAAALRPGTLHIGERCVTLDVDGGGSILLVWRSPEVEWNEEGRTIRFAPKSGRGEPVTLADGDRDVSFGGSEVSRDADIKWRSRPDPSCPSDHRWSVHSVARAE